MDKPMPKIMFMGQCLMIKCRDIFRPREIILGEVDIKPDSKVLDFGCGPGSYIIHVSKTVGERGKVYALDIHPLAIEKVKSIAPIVRQDYQTKRLVQFCFMTFFTCLRIKEKCCPNYIVF